VCCMSPVLVITYGRGVVEYPSSCYYIGLMVVRVELEREDDGRWIAEVVDLPGVMAYGSSREQALAAVQALALRVIADQIEHGEANLGEASDISFLADGKA
jgi:predicted RNase H-like HicB family nuclease